MVQVYQIEKTGGVWVLLTRQEFGVIFERYCRGIVEGDDQDEEISRVTKALNWINRVVQGEESAPLFNGSVESPMQEKIRVLMPDSTVREMKMELEYLPAVVGSEMPKSFCAPIEALKAQAIAARSFARAAKFYGLYRNKGGGYHSNAEVCTTTHCQAWIPEKIYPEATEAVNATQGLTAQYGGRVILTYYSARCGGRTRNNEDVYTHQLSRPYLRAVDCPDKGTKIGHGVGLCQYGAKELALQGVTYIDILRHYYKGIEVE